jgi:ATP-binding cassette subfamily B protein
MSLRDWVNALTGNQPKILIGPILWQLLAAIFQVIPAGLALLTILEWYNHLKTGNDVDTTYLGLLCGGTVLSSILFYIVNRIAYTSAYAMAEDLIDKGQLELANHMKNLSMGFFCSRDSGDLSTLLIRDFENVMNLMSVMLPQFVSGALFPIVAIIVLFFFDWRLTLCITLVILVALPFVIISRYLVDWIGRKHHNAIKEANSRMLEYIAGIKPIKAFNIGGEQF